MRNCVKMICKLTLLGLGLTGLLISQEEATRKIQISNTETMPFPAGGLLHIRHAAGNMTIEAWARPQLELTTVRSTLDEHPASDRTRITREMERISVKPEQQGDEIGVTTVFPRSFWSKLWGSKFAIAYHIKIPASGRLTVDEGSGQVFIDRVRGDIHVTAFEGLLQLSLPDKTPYAIDARSKLGSVVSDFPGQEHKAGWFFGQAFADQPSANAQKLFLRIRYGDIIILKTAEPAISTEAGE
jgi:hypothetical protein